MEEEGVFLPELVYYPDVNPEEPIYSFPKNMFWVEAVRQFVSSVAYLMQLEGGPRVCYQIIVPSRKEVRFVQHMNRAVKIPVNTVPVEPGDSDRPCDFGLYSAENWMGKILPTLTNSPLTYIICIVDWIEYDYRIETILRLLSQKPNKFSVRTLCTPGAILSENKFTTLEIDANCQFPYRLENIKRFKPLGGPENTLEIVANHIDEVESRPEVKDILVVLPTLKFAGMLFEHLTLNSKSARTVIMPSEITGEVKKQPSKDGPFDIICATPATIYNDYFPSVTCIIDTCLRKCRTLNTETLKIASKAAISELVSIVAEGKKYFTLCLCVDSKSYMELPEFEKSTRSGRELTYTILELEDAGMGSCSILVRNEKEESFYREYYGEMLRCGLLEVCGVFASLTERGKFALATRLSIRSTHFLDSVFSVEKFWKESREYRYPIFVACMIAVWIDMESSVFMPALSHKIIVSQSEFSWEDSLENYLDVVLSHMGEAPIDGFNWCAARGINYSALLNALSNIRCLLEAIERKWGVEVPRPKRITKDYIERATAIDDKRDLVPILCSVFEDQQYASYFGQIRNTKTQEVFRFDDCVEHDVRKKVVQSGTTFINASAERSSEIVNKIVFTD